jgi:hypothetical protein
MHPKVDMLREAIDTAAENPAHFNLSIEDIKGRRTWLETQRSKVRILRFFAISLGFMDRNLHLLNIFVVEWH